MAEGGGWMIFEMRAGGWIFFLGGGCAREGGIETVLRREDGFRYVYLEEQFGEAGI